MKIVRVLTFLFLVTICFGFRMIPGMNSWGINTQNPTLWVRFCKYPNITKHEYPSGDVLYGTQPTFTQLFQSILNDYHATSGFFARLAFYPADPNNPPTPQPGDSTFTTAAATGRTIDICFEQQTFTGGYAKPKLDDTGKVIGCTIQINEKEAENGKYLVRTLTHEMGHCFGLDHAHENTDAVMSYYSTAIRLRPDDRMGLVFLYPRSPNDAKEAATYGLSCSAKN